MAVHLQDGSLFPSGTSHGAGHENIFNKGK
jgi:hypothetical protein